MKFLIILSIISLFFFLYLFHSQNFLTPGPPSQILFILFKIEEASGFPPSNNLTDFIEEMHLKGHELDNMGRHEEAIKIFDQILSIDNNYTHGLTGEGWAYLHLGNYNEALNWFDKTLAIDKNFYFALTGKAIALTNLGKYQEAIPWYDKALSINPNNLEIKSKKELALSKIYE